MLTRLPFDGFAVGTYCRLVVLRYEEAVSLVLEERDTGLVHYQTAKQIARPGIRR